MSLCKLLACKPVTVGFFPAVNLANVQGLKADVRVMLSKPLLSVPLLWISNWFVYNYNQI